VRLIHSFDLSDYSSFFSGLSSPERGVVLLYKKKIINNIYIYNEVEGDPFSNNKLAPFTPITRTLPSVGTVAVYGK